MKKWISLVLSLTLMMQPLVFINAEEQEEGSTNTVVTQSCDTNDTTNNSIENAAKKIADYKSNKLGIDVNKKHKKTFGPKVVGCIEKVNNFIDYFKNSQVGRFISTTLSAITLVLTFIGLYKAAKK